MVIKLDWLLLRHFGRHSGFIESYQQIASTA